MRGGCPATDPEQIFRSSPNRPAAPRNSEASQVSFAEVVKSSLQEFNLAGVLGFGGTRFGPERPMACGLADGVRPWTCFAVSHMEAQR